MTEYEELSRKFKDALINWQKTKNPYDELLAFSKEMALKLIPPQGASLAIGLTKQALHNR